jgi:hypothetical protein
MSGLEVAAFIAAGVVGVALGGAVLVGSAVGTIYAIDRAERKVMRRNRARTTGVPVLFGDAAVIARADKAGER